VQYLFLLKNSMFWLSQCRLMAKYYLYQMSLMQLLQRHTCQDRIALPLTDFEE